MESRLEKQSRILVVDDEEDLCEILQFNLEGEGYTVDVAYSAEEALRKDLGKYHLFLLDVMMGEMSGFRLAEILKKEMKITVPFIFITAKDKENDLLTGFNLGSDDYITKPFSVKEVLVRVKAVLRRPVRESRTDSEGSFSAGEIRIDPGSGKLTLEGREVVLTRKEFEILLLLVRNPGRFFSREEILGQVWSEDVLVNDRTIDVHVTRIRKKLGSYGKCLVGRSGYGYSLQCNES